MVRIPEMVGNKILGANPMDNGGDLRIPLIVYLDDSRHAKSQPEDHNFKEIRLERLLPKSLPVLSNYELAAEYLPIEPVGGDYYNIALIDPRTLFLMLTDVSGHGLPAARVMATAKTAFDRNIREHRDISQVMAGVNRDLCAAIKTEHYLTAFAGVLDLETGLLRYCRVGHPYPLLIRGRDGSVEWLESHGGFFLGMFPGSVYEEKQVTLESGDLLYVYTDGITETMNAKGALYGRDRLEKVFRDSGSKPLQEILLAVNSDRERFAGEIPAEDDISAFALRRRPATPE